MYVDWLFLPTRRATACVTTVITAALMLAACDRQKTPQVPPTPKVGVLTVQQSSIPMTTELPGRTSAYLVAEVRARVDGIVLRREFAEGGDVKAGQRLYKIDPDPYQAQLDNAKAQLAKARANLASTTAQANRYRLLVAANAVSQQDYDNAVAAQQQAAADVAAGKAAVKTARINLGYTDVVAPISGRIGKSSVTPGAYVQASQATLLATVQQTDPIYVDLTQSSADGLKLRRAIAQGKLRIAGKDGKRAATPVTLLLEDGTLYPQTGTLQFSDITVEPSTGAVSIRALFPNPHQLLLPGMFVRARLTEGINDQAILVPQIAITHDAKGQPVALIVDSQGKVVQRSLQASRTLGPDWVVEAGLRAGDQVIVQGGQKVQPGMTVKSVKANLPQVGASPPSPAARLTSSSAAPATRAQ